ncbi:uncharacterized protein LOC132043952 [Lycium ferocissimum]|uniref:uncharacterized protein LOC132043952 n=1 Tax=Lycium ferocissimum TaxID=112874 RepID=UPI002814D3FB|nr:uncharacterized protein LOC132043952 [Lycium ferocissimum]
MQEMARENVVTVPGEKMREIQEKIKKMRRQIGVGAGLLYVHAYGFRRKKERREKIAIESRRTMMDVDTEKNEKNLNLMDSELLGKESSKEVAQTLTVMKTEKNTAEKRNYALITEHGDQQCEETFKEDRRTMADKGTSKNVAETVKNVAEKKLNDGEVQSEDSSQTMTDTKTEKETDEKNCALKRKYGNQQGVEAFREDVEVRTKRHVEHAIKMMRALHGSSSDDDYAVFRNSKSSFDDHFRELLCCSGALKSTEAATVEGGKETNTDCVIESLAKRVIKDLELTFFGSDTEYDPSDDLDIKTSKILERMEYCMCELFRLYVAEESEKDKMASNGADLKRRKTENITDCDVKSSLEKEEGGKSEA